MRVTEVRASYGLTVNAGNYNSERLEVSLTGELAPDEITDRVIEELISTARHSVISRLAKSDNPNVRRYFEGPSEEELERPF
jgi:hypothetical protein